MPVRHLIAALVGSTLALGCADKVIDDEPAINPNAPRIYITSPERGTMVPDAQISVEGRVVDDDSDVDKLEINGIPVIIRSDGTFSTLVPVDDGITLIRTIATDSDGNEGTDTRSVMAGNMVTLDTPVLDGAAGRLGRSTFEKINKTMVNLLESPGEIAKLAESINPLVDAGTDCNGIVLDLESVVMSSADVEVLPVQGGITFKAVLDDVDVKMLADFDLVCVSGSSGIHARADQATVSGFIAIGLDRGSLNVELESINSTFTNLDIDVGVVSSDIIELFLWDLEGLAGSIVESLIKSQVDSFVDSFLTDFVRGQWELNIGSAQLVFGASPTMVEFNDDGGFLAVDTTVIAKNPRDNAGYIATPSAAPIQEMQNFEGFRAVIADDFVNQAFAAYWSTGAMEKAVAFDSDVEKKESFLGSNIDRVEVTVLLPPYVDARDDKALSITVGDVLVDVIDEGAAGDAVVTRLALSGTMDISVTVDKDNQLSFKTVTPSLWVDILDEGVTGTNPFNRDEIEVLASFVAARFAGAADDLIGEIPIPSLAGTTVKEAELAPDRGYVIVGGELTIPN